MRVNEMTRKYYDWNKIRELIEDNIPKGLESAEIGFREDWSNTSDVAWSVDKGYFKKIDDLDYDGERRIVGIYCSDWDTPIIKLYFDD